MLLFAVVPAEALPETRRAGLSRTPDAPLRLWRTLDAAQAGAPESGVVLAVDAETALPRRRDEDAWVEAAAVPSGAILNIDPYRPVRPVEAAGGYVMRAGPDEPEVLLIYRNGVWDLPKGKLDRRETPEEGALREVREEVGITRLRLLGPLGTTLHGYERGGAYWAKTTYWYRMATDETTFTPQQNEGIERVAWMPWSEAVRRIGYESLRRHMASFDPAEGA